MTIPSWIGEVSYTLGVFRGYSMAGDEMRVSRVTRSKADARASYDKMSRWYDLLAGRFEKRYREAGLQMLCAQEGEAVLEIGFGTGRCILTLARSVGSSGKVHGIDISEGMCCVARSLVEKAGLAGRVELRCDDAAALPFGPELFDAVFMSFTLELFDTPEIPTLLRECERVLRDGGRICVVGMSKKSPTAMTRLYEWSHRRFPTCIDCRPIFVLAMLSDAGFRILHAEELPMWGLLVEVVLAQKQ